MVRPVRRASTLVTFVCMTGLLVPAAADDPLPRETVARRAKASTALVDAKPSYGSAFCVHSSGLFITNEHVVRQKGDTVTLVLNAGLKSQQLLKAKVLRRDMAADLALLKVDGDEKVEPLELGSDAELAELTELIACGFPFGVALGRQGEYPTVSVNVGSLTSLRRDKTGELHRIQLDAALNPGNSGGPVLDRTGKVVGMVVSGIRGSGVNQAIPVSHLKRFLARPEVFLTLPAVTAANRHDAFDFTARTVSLIPTKDVPELELILSTESVHERRFPMTLAGGVYRAKAVPFPARQGPPVCRVEVKYEDGLISGTAEDRTFRVGATEVKLSQVRSLRTGPKPEARLGDGRRLEGKPTGLEAVPVQVGKQSLRLDLAGATEVNVEAPREVTALSCVVLVRQAGREVGRHSAPLYIEGVSQPSGRSELSMDLKKKMDLADGPVAGKIAGADFQAEKVQLQTTGLTLQSGRDNIHLFLNIKPGKDVYEYHPDDQPPRNRPSVHVHMTSANPPSVAAYSKDYVMRLEFGKEKDGKIPGRLYLCLPDETRSCIVGSFTLDSE
jgi:hypothetical protein